MQQNKSLEPQTISILEGMVGSEVYVIKNGKWRGKVEGVVDGEYFMVSKFDDPAVVEKVSMYDIRSLSYETF